MTASNSTAWIHQPHVATALDAWYADARIKDPQARQSALAAGGFANGERSFFAAMRTAYMPIDRAFGSVLYALVLGARARTVVEFGTSFGVSTVFLAAALRDAGQGGRVITTEYDQGKADQARANLASVGLDGLVEIRVGDALQTLRDPALPEIDMVFLDGAKTMYLDVLRTVEPSLRRGGLVASDNTDHDGMEDFLRFLRDPANGYVSAGVLTGGERMARGHELSVRV